MNLTISTLACPDWSLAQIIEAPFVELDALNWQANWTMTDVETFREQVRTVTAADAWVVDGNYGGRGARDIIWPRADTVVWLDLPLLVTLLRIAKRSACGGSRKNETGPRRPSTTRSGARSPSRRCCAMCAERS